MALTVQAMAASVGLACVGAFGVFRYIQSKERKRLALAKADLAAYSLAAGGLLTLVPEAMAAFAPELMRGGTLTSLGLQHLDYVSFVLVSVSFGMGLARRWLIVQLEQAS